MTSEKRPKRQDKKKPAKSSKANEFASLDFPEMVFKGIVDAGFSEMTPIQKQALPVLLNGKDICGQAQTGTGKTATFLLAIFSRLVEENQERPRSPLALIVAPTRELALQIYREGQTLGKYTELKMAAVYGGEGFAKQERRLKSGVHIVVGTPGRLLDFARRRVLNFSQIRHFVLDEADRMLDMGFRDELRDILRRLPHPKKRQSMLFSATLDFRTKQIAFSNMNNPVDVAVKPEKIAAEGIDQAVYHVERETKLELLLGILGKEPIPKGLIFSNTKIVAMWLSYKLNQHGYKSELLTGDLSQKARNRVLEKFKNNEVPLLVASDVASRGLHIDDVTHIINYDVPQDPEDYVHRIGRTARAGKKGKAYTLACDEYCWALPDIEKLMGNPLPYQVPYDEDFAEDQTPEYTIRKMKIEESRKKKARKQSRNSHRKGGGYKGRPGGPKSNAKAKPGGNRKRRPRPKPDSGPKKSS